PERNRAVAPPQRPPGRRQQVFVALALLPLAGLYGLFVCGLGWTLGAFLGCLVGGTPGLVGGGILGLLLVGAGTAAAAAGRPPLWAGLFWLGCALCGGASCGAVCSLLLWPAGRGLPWGWLLGAILGLPAGLLGTIFCFPGRSALHLSVRGAISGLLAGLL